CVRCHGSSQLIGGGENLYNGSVVQVPDLANVCGGANTGHSQIRNIVDIRNTIMQGRPGTDMPSWSVRFQGALDDQQIQDLLSFVVSIQDKKLVPLKYNVCINTKAKGYEAPTEPAS